MLNTRNQRNLCNYSASFYYKTKEYLIRMFSEDAFKMQKIEYSFIEFNCRSFVWAL